MNQYVELHARSAFSFLEGSSLPEELAAACARLGIPAMALLDTDGVYGAPRFHLAAQKAKIKAHIGAEVTCNSLHSVILSGAGASRSEALAQSTQKNWKSMPPDSSASPAARMARWQRLCSRAAWTKAAARSRV